MCFSSWILLLQWSPVILEKKTIHFFTISYHLLQRVFRQLQSLLLVLCTWLVIMTYAQPISNSFNIPIYRSDHISRFFCSVVRFWPVSHISGNFRDKFQIFFCTFSSLLHCILVLCFVFGSFGSKNMGVENSFFTISFWGWQLWFILRISPEPLMKGSENWTSQSIESQWGHFARSQPKCCYCNRFGCNQEVWHSLHDQPPKNAHFARTNTTCNQLVYLCGREYRVPSYRASKQTSLQVALVAQPDTSLSRHLLLVFHSLIPLDRGLWTPMSGDKSISSNIV